MDLTDADRRTLERIEDSGDTQGLAWRVDQMVREAKAEAWDEGHKAPQRRGPDDCHCGAYYDGECACGYYGSGELVSLKNNPYRD